MAESLSDLKSQIDAAERAVVAADARAAETARVLKAHWRARAPSIAIGAASAFVAWKLVRGRRRAHLPRPGRPASWGHMLGPVLRYAGPQLSTAITALVAGLVAGKAKKPLAHAPLVDLERFSGVWYEIARLPEKWEKDCASDVTARYEPTIDGGLRVIHRCRRADGGFKRTVGRAEVSDPETNAKLRISYAPALLDALPFVWKEYTIIDVARDYSSAVIGTSDRAHLWLLARSPNVPEDARSAFVAKALGQGFDTSQIVYTQHSPPAGAAAGQEPARVESTEDANRPESTAASPPATEIDRVAAAGQGERQH